MRHTSHLASLLALAALAPAADAQVVVELIGTVTSNTLTSGPFAGAQIGDNAVEKFEVFLPGVPTTIWSSEYDVNAAASSLQVGAAFDVFAPNPPKFGLYTGDFTDGARLYNAPMAGGGELSFQLSAMLGTIPSAEITLSAGTYPASAFFFTEWFLEDATGGVLALDPIELIINAAALGQNYCVSTNNSTGVPAVISATGSPSVIGNELTLMASGLPDQPGLFFHGTSIAQVPFGDGFRCVGLPIVRLNPPVVASGGMVSVDVDLFQEGIGAGLRYFQFWYRDPAASGAGFNLSDGRAINFLP